MLRFKSPSSNISLGTINSSDLQRKSTPAIVRVLLMSLCAVIIGCTHPVGVDGTGQGDITSSTGTRNCSAEQKLCNFVISEDYIESYTAIPREGSYFSHWEGCLTEDGPVCSWNVPKSTVAQFYFQTMAPLKAVFEDSSNREALYVVLQDANYHYWIGSVDLESKVIKPLFDMYPFKFLEAGLANGKIYGWDLNSFFAADLATTTTTPTGERGPPYFCWGSADIASTKNLLRCFSNYYFTGLYNVSLPTGKINELLSIGPAFSQRLILLAYAPDGKLYATGDHPLVAHGPEYLLEVNTTNGAIRVIALLEDGVGSDFEAMTFVNNQLIGLGDATDTITRYGTEYEVKTQGFFNIDHKTGATSLIAHVEDFSGIQGFSIVDVVN